MDFFVILHRNVSEAISEWLFRLASNARKDMSERSSLTLPERGGSFFKEEIRFYRLIFNSEELLICALNLWKSRIWSASR